MGTSSTMKMFVVLALAAAAVAEPEAAADAQYVSAYGNYGAYGAYGAYPYTHNLPLTTYNHAAAPLTSYAASPLNTYAASPLNTYAASPLTTYAASPLVRSFTHGLYNRHIIAKREAEAEADPALIYGSYAAAPYARYGHFSHVAAPFVRTVAAPVVRTVAAPVVRTVAAPFVRTVAAPAVRTVAAPAVRTVAAPLTAYNYNHVVSPVVRALASHTVTSYNSPTHYTAVSNGVYGPSYVAKNGAVQHVVKREADAEAEADPAFVYNTVPTYATSNVVAPLASTYAVASPLTTTYNHVATPLTTYSHVAAPLTTTYNHVVAPLTTTYNNVVASPSPVTYAHVASNGAHAVAATPMGWTHSANVGICTNFSGQQVAC